MRIDQHVIKRIVNALLENSSPKMRMSSLGIATGFMEGDLSDPIRAKIDDNKLDGFRGHLLFLKDKGVITSNDPQLGIIQGLGGDWIVNTSVYYELTSYGHEYAIEINRSIFSKLLTQVFETSGKIFWLVLGGLISAFLTFITTLLTACK